MRFLKIFTGIFFAISVNYIPFHKIQTGEWDTLPFLLFFWLESAILIFFSILKIYKIAKYGDEKIKYEGYSVTINGEKIDPKTLTPKQATFVPALVMIAFLVAHFVFIFPISATTFAPDIDKVSETFKQLQVFLQSFIWVFPALVISAYVNYKFIFMTKKEYLTSRLDSHMARPLLRIFLLQGALIVGAILVATFNSPIMIVGFLLGFKMFGEIIQAFATPKDSLEIRT